MLRLSLFAQFDLDAAPESGMGFHLVEFDLDRSRVQGLALNASLVPLESDLGLVQERLPFERLAKSAPELIDPANLRVLRREHLQRGTKLSQLMGVRTSGVSEAPIEFSESGSRYFRFSAFRDDRRILEDGSLRPGTYATTDADGAQVKTGLEAVDRYALPNPDPAVHRFRIAPRTKTPLRQGIVQPAYGHRGGGTEIIFEMGTNPGSLIDHAVLPER